MSEVPLYSKLDVLGVRSKIVRVGARKSLSSPNGSVQIDSARWPVQINFAGRQR